MLLVIERFIKIEFEDLWSKFKVKVKLEVMVEL